MGLTETTPREAEFINGHNISRLSPEALGGSSEKVLEWLRSRGAKHRVAFSHQQGHNVTEYLPWSVIKFAKSLEDLPLLGKARS